MIPQRVILGLMSFLGVVVIFQMQSCLSIAITEMVVPIINTETSHDTTICPAVFELTDTSNVTKTSGTKYNWSQIQQGWILSAYFIGYTISNIPGGMLAEKYGGKWVLSLGTLILTICNALIPQALENGGDNAHICLIILRMLMGLSAGPSYPSVTVLLAAWIPQKERGAIGTLVLSGSSIGILLSVYSSSIMLSYWSWPIVFYVFSLTSIIWISMFTIFCYSDPSSNPFISREERDYLKVELGQLKRSDDLPSTPWIEILTSVPVVVLIISQVGSDWLFYVLASDLPKYMKEVLGFTVREVGFYSSVPYILTWIDSIVAGCVCDYLINRNILSVLSARKFFSTLSGMVPALFMVAASYAGCNKLLVVVCFFIAIALRGTYYPGIRINALDLSPNYAGSILVLSNGVGSLSGLIVPTFIGYMTPDSTLVQWRFVFWTSFFITIVKTVIYLIWGSADIQPWNDPNTTHLAESDRLTGDVKETRQL